MRNEGQSFAKIRGKETRGEADERAEEPPVRFPVFSLDTPDSDLPHAGDRSFSRIFPLLLPRVDINIDDKLRRDVELLVSPSPEREKPPTLDPRRGSTNVRETILTFLTDVTCEKFLREKKTERHLNKICKNDGGDFCNYVSVPVLIIKSLG